METLKELRERFGAEFIDYKVPSKDFPKSFIFKYYDDKTKEFITKKCEDGVYTIIEKEKVQDDFDTELVGIQWDNLDQNEEVSAKGVKGTLKRY